MQNLQVASLFNYLYLFIVLSVYLKVPRPKCRPTVGTRPVAPSAETADKPHRAAEEQGMQGCDWCAHHSQITAVEKVEIC